MLIVLRPEAEQELLEAQTWYESKALGLGWSGLVVNTCRLYLAIATSQTNKSSLTLMALG